MGIGQRGASRPGLTAIDLGLAEPGEAGGEGAGSGVEEETETDDRPAAAPSEWGGGGAGRCRRSGQPCCTPQGWEGNAGTGEVWQAETPLFRRRSLLLTKISRELFW